MVLLCDFHCKTLCCPWYSGLAFDLETHSTSPYGKGLLWTLVFLCLFLRLALNLSAELWTVAYLKRFSDFSVYKVIVGCFAGLMRLFLSWILLFNCSLNSLVTLLCFLDRLWSQGLRLRFLLQ